MNNIEIPSLRKEAKRVMRERHGNLTSSLKSTVKQAYFRTVANVKYWWITVTFVVASFSICFFDYGLLSVLDVKNETIRALVDHRISNIATITSITLVIVGFLINNLAVKESLTFKLLFEKSSFFPIVFLILCTIGALVLFSTLRDDLPVWVLSNGILWGTYLAILILFLIGFLFIKVIRFTDSEHINNLVSEELLAESKSYLKKQVLLRISSSIVEELLQKFPVTKFDMSLAIARFLSLGDSNEAPIRTDSTEGIRYVIIDVHHQRLKKFLENISVDEKWQYKSFSLGTEFIDHPRSLLWPGEREHSKDEKVLINKCFKYSKVKPTSDEDTWVYRKYFEKKLDRLVKAKNHKEVETLLKSYEKIYDLQFIVDLK